MELIRYQPFDGSLRATVLFPRDCVANMGHIDFGMTARLISGSHLLHTKNGLRSIQLQRMLLLKGLD